MMAKILLLLFFIPVPVFSSVFKLLEADLPALVEKANGRIAGSSAEILARRASLGHLQRSFLPQVRLNFGSEFTKGRPQNDVTNSYEHASAGFSFNLFNGGRDVLKEKSLKAGLEVAKSGLENSRWGVLTEARSLYWQMIYQKEIILILESAMKLNEVNLNSALKKMRSNLATQTDEIDFRQTQIQLEQDLRKSRLLLVNNMREMASILNHSLDTKYEVPDLNVHEPDHVLDDFSDHGFKAEGHRQIKMLEALQSSFQFESELNSRWWSPEIDLYGLKVTRFETLRRTNEIDRDVGEVLGVRLTFYFDGFQTRSNSVAQSYQALAYSHQRRQRLLEIRTSYANTYQLYVLNHDLVHSAEENNKVAQRYYDIIWKEYMRGIKNSPDVLQAFKRIVEAKLRYAGIKKDYQVARAEILGYLQE